MLVTVAVTTVVWLVVTFLTRPEPDAVLDAFYRRVRPGGPGLGAVSTRLGLGREPIPGGALAWTNWIAGIVAVYATLFGIGKLVFGELGVGLDPARHRGGRIRLDRPVVPGRTGARTRHAGRRYESERDRDRALHA